MSDERFVAIEAKLEELVTGQRELKTDVQDLGRQMRVLHEDTIDRISALAPDFGPLKREFVEADERLRDQIDQRLTPLEAQAHRRQK